MERNETLKDTAVVFKLDFASGLVDPQERIDNGEISQETVEELKERIINGDFDKPIDPDSVAELCMDHRPTENGEILVGAKGAGGTIGYAVGDALTSSRFRKAGEAATTHLKRIVSVFQDGGKNGGGHYAKNATHPEAAGCGAADNLNDSDINKPTGLKRITSHGKEIFSLLGSIGVETSENEQSVISDNAQTLIEEGYGARGKEIVDAGAEVAGKEKFPTLDGDLKHAVLAVIIANQGIVLDHAAIERAYGAQYRVFEVSAWAVANGADKISISKDEARLKAAATLGYTVAVASTLVSDNMQFVYRPDPLQTV